MAIGNGRSWRQKSRPEQRPQPAAAREGGRAGVRRTAPIRKSKRTRWSARAVQPGRRLAATGGRLRAHGRTSAAMGRF